MYLPLCWMGYLTATPIQANSFNQLIKRFHLKLQPSWMNRQKIACRTINACSASNLNALALTVINKRVRIYGVGENSTIKSNGLHCIWNANFCCEHTSWDYHSLHSGLIFIRLIDSSKSRWLSHKKIQTLRSCTFASYPKRMETWTNNRNIKIQQVFGNANAENRDWMLCAFAHSVVWVYRCNVLYV